jgi:hypothetical protein
VWSIMRHYCRFHNHLGSWCLHQQRQISLNQNRDYCRQDIRKGDQPVKMT